MTRQLPAAAARRSVLQTLRTQPEVEECLAPPPGLAPDSEWQTDFLCQFADVRQSLRRWSARGPPQVHPRKLPARTDVQAWRRICGWEPERDGARPSLPQLSACTALEQVDVQHLVQLHAHWLDDAWEEEGAEALTDQRAAWLFALLARLDADLLADTAASLRHIFRVLTRVRARHSASEAASARVASVNVLITIIARYFKQAGPGEG